MRKGGLRHVRGRGFGSGKVGRGAGTSMRARGALFGFIDSDVALRFSSVGPRTIFTPTMLNHLVIN